MANCFLDRVNETLSVEPAVQDKEHPVHISQPDKIVMKDLTFRYPTSTVDNLSHINITLRRGQTLGVVGRTGSGKSTLLKQPLHEYPAGSGTLSISGHSIEDIAKDDLHSWIGYVPQEQVLFSKSVRQNIQFGKPGASDDVIMEAIRTAHSTGIWGHCLTVWIHLWVKKVLRCPADRNSGFLWPGPLSLIPTFSFSTMPCPRSMHGQKPKLLKIYAANVRAKQR